MVHPIQTINIDGQEALFIPTPMTNLGSQFLPGGQVVRPNVLQTIQLPNGAFLLEKFHYCLFLTNMPKNEKDKCFCRTKCLC